MSKSEAKKFAEMENALKAIRSAALHDHHQGKQWALRPAEVVALCDRALN